MTTNKTEKPFQTVEEINKVYLNPRVAGGGSTQLDGQVGQKIASDLLERFKTKFDSGRQSHTDRES